MNELPLSKFAPFTKDECHFQSQVSNKLKDIDVRCSNCIYLGGELTNVEALGYMFHLNETLDQKHYKCNILSDGNNMVHENSLCKFFTNLEEVDPPEKEEVSKDVTESQEELSIQIQKLDFTNSNISESINKLREKLLNE